ncbi:hypothetical protein F5Y06DRAFT_54701 [Hypoxylon sp. FL0890]|nr:hypothetical protein F5Y06DRAFT_54701 [Hypoxylon sp. FL0890]
MSGFDWDDMLLSIDWEKENWRLYYKTLQNVPWEEVQTSTVQRLEEQHRAWDAANPESVGDDKRMSPAFLEYFRRQTSMPPDQPWSPNRPDSVRDWITDKGPDTPAAQTPKYKKKQMAQKPKDESIGLDKPGFFTFGFELELPIAVHMKGGLFVDPPHPNETRWLEEGIVNEKMPRAEVQRRVVEEALRVLNSQTDMVFIRKDPDEGTELYKLKMENLDRIDRGLPKLGPEAAESSPSGPESQPVVSPVAETAAEAAFVTALATTFNTDAGGKNLALATEKDLKDAVNETAMLSLITTSDRTSAKSRCLDLLQLHAFRAKRDRHHVALRDMKPRYRAFSVYAMDYSPVMDREDYTDAPSAKNFWANQYHYEVIKIASPVLRLGGEALVETQDMLQQISSTMRGHFRIHRNLPAIQTTTQIVVSHTTGFTLLEIKKIVTLVAIIEEAIAALNRRHRSTAPYDNVCGPIKRHSKLAAMARCDPSIPGFDWEGILPRLPVEQQRAQLEEMEKYVPVDLLAKAGNNKLEDKTFYSSVWQYKTVNDLARAVTTGVEWRKLDLQTKCTGLGEQTEPVEIEVDEAVRAEAWDHDLNFNVVDAVRGVFEFRKCATTLDVGHILSWLDICCQIIGVAKSSSAEEYKTLLTRLLKGEPVLHVLRILDVVQNFYKERMGNSAYFDPRDTSVSWKNPFYDAD